MLEFCESAVETALFSTIQLVDCIEILMSYTSPHSELPHTVVIASCVTGFFCLYSTGICHGDYMLELTHGRCDLEILNTWVGAKSPPKSENKVLYRTKVNFSFQLTLCPLTFRWGRTAVIIKYLRIQPLLDITHTLDILILASKKLHAWVNQVK